MSRGASKVGVDACGDCDAPDPTWASLNRGLLLCTECASAHRSLGRHISRIKYLKRGFWSASQQNMVISLHADGLANAIWEHVLHESTKLTIPRSSAASRKPTPHSPLPIKAEFVLNKHGMSAFAVKSDMRVENGDELSRQLYAAVQTPNLEVSLRLLYLGADPNYFHPSTLNCPVHVATKAGQAEQIELLVVYGADVTVLDGTNGKTPVQIARDSGDAKLVLRLEELEYEVSDRLAYFVCGKRADHVNGQHFTIPQLPGMTTLPPESARTARQRLQELSNINLSHLALDLQDEVDRRELESVQMSLSTTVRDVISVPQLPWHPGVSKARNESRQRLASLSHANLCLLIIDCLAEAKRRRDTARLGASQSQTLEMKRGGLPDAKGNVVVVKGSTWSASSQRAHLSSYHPMEDGDADYDEPCNDSVASEDDYAIVDKEKKLSIRSSIPPRAEPLNQRGDNVDKQRVVVLEAKLKDSLRTIDELMLNNRQLNDQVSAMQSRIHQLLSENQSLRGRRGGSAEPAFSDEKRNLWQNSPVTSQYFRQSGTSSDIPHPHGFLSGQFLSSDGSKAGATGVQRSNSLHLHQPRPSTMFETTSPKVGLADADKAGGTSSDSLPSNEEVQKAIRPVTLGLQEVTAFIKTKCDAKQREDNDAEVFKQTVHKVHQAVMNLMIAFPKPPVEGAMKDATKKLIAATSKLMDLGDNWGENVSAPLKFDVASLRDSVISCAFEVAKATKEIFTLVEQQRVKELREI